MAKLTFSMDDDTVRTLRRAAERTGKTQSAVVREAITRYEANTDRLTEEERQRMVRLFDELLSRPPDRTQAEVDAEIREIRRARRHGGRRTRVE
jgi:Arc/MetJ-type ribon-helix-helix transcriptional regulator